MMGKENKKFKGNIYLRNAEIYAAGKFGDFTTGELMGIQAFATLALAEEQRTANLIEYFQLTGPTEEAEDIEIEIRERLGLSE